MGAVKGAPILEPGTFFGRYYVIAPLGEGGMSQVFLGYDCRAPRFVALKLPRERFAGEASAIGRLRREGEIYQTLRHGSIVRLVDGGPLEGGGYFLAQEYLRGESLTETLDGIGGPMPLPQAMVIFEDMAAALNVAHRAGVVHRDVQPDNVMVGPDGRATIFDFGIAKADDDLVRTEAGTVMGTLVYASPEQRRGEPVDHRADVFGLGAILYEMLTGRKAIQARTFEEAMEATTEHLPLPSRRNRDVPDVLDEICRRLIADKLSERYPDLRTMLVDLGKLRLEGDEEVKRRVFGTVERRAIDEAILAFREGDVRQAEAISDRLEAACPAGMECELHHLQAMIHERNGRPDLAGRSYAKAVFHDPTHIDVALDYAMHLLGQQENDRALKVLDGIPGIARGNLLVLGLIDAIGALPSAPATVFADPEPEKPEPSGILGSIRSLFRKP